MLIIRTCIVTFSLLSYELGSVGSGNICLQNYATCTYTILATHLPKLRDVLAYNWIRSDVNRHRAANHVEMT